ncbi:HlyC/CorC family transporter [Congregibacter litoralis]|uniref:Putative Mg2+ and Co2+ transporter CorB n=1 Tax=Congregibacter litoralis KT71 TaxID=314285 RepID=A4ADG7_9GAMM|nr:HlyC/CorC family transporter [Congregibacter litoralis]EAQ95965.1 putative Mg2+ and Co2+ transporter CorB [Congregibacter litoralis KT71]
MNDAPLGLLFAVLAALILMSGFFSSSETGMMSLNRYRLKHLRKQHHKGAMRASKLLERPDRLIGLILIGNNLVNIAASAIATVIAIRLYGDAGIVIATILLTLVILIFAEVTPKTIAALYPEKIAFPASVVLLPLMRLLIPLVAIVNWVTNGLLRLLGINTNEAGEERVSREELRTIVSDPDAMIPQRHRGMLVNILDLEGVTVDDIMVPRNEFYGIDLDESDECILETIHRSSHTLLPVWREDSNNIEGVLHLRNVSRVVDRDGLSRSGLIAALDKPYFIPESTPLHTQLRNFQQKKFRLALVVDEYGDVIGLVAVADILEEIVGEFTSNLSDSSDEIYPQRDGSYVFDGGASVRDINKALKWELPTDGPKTLSGLVLEYLESFPDGNAGLRISNYCFEILELEGNVVRAVKGRPSE